MSKKHDRPDKLPPPKHSDPSVFFNNAHGPAFDKPPAPPPPPTLIGEPASYVAVPTQSSSAAPSPAPPPPPPAPLLPTFVPSAYSTRVIKVAPSDIIQFDESTVEIQLLKDLIFEDLGATELANISRSDLIDGQETIYSIIKNLSSIRREFNPNNVIATAYNSDYFTRFGIDLVARGMNEPYFDENGNLVIEIDTVLDGEEIQVQVLSNGIIDTIEES